MCQNQGTVLRNGKITDPPSETTPPEDLNMAQANSNDSDINDNSDISSQLYEIKESYERRISELHQEFSQLKDLMMAIVNKNSSDTQPSSSQGPSKRSQQQGFDTHFNSFNVSATCLFIRFHLCRFYYICSRFRLSSASVLSGSIHCLKHHFN